MSSCLLSCICIDGSFSFFAILCAAELDNVLALLCCTNRRLMSHLYVLQCLFIILSCYHYRFCVLWPLLACSFVCGGGVLLCWRTSYYIVYRRAIWRAACPRGVVVVYYIRLLLLLWTFWECCRRSVVVVCTMICFLDDFQGVSCLCVLL